MIPFLSRLWAPAVLIVLATPMAASGVDDGRSCVGLSVPTDGEIVRRFRPIGRYEGHWGIDWGESSSNDVRAAAGGVVTFSGVVVDNRTVTIDHGGGLKTSYSYLSVSRTHRGDRIRRGETIGDIGTGTDHGDLHFSVRIHGRYVDPQPMLGCRRSSPMAALSLTQLSG